MSFGGNCLVNIHAKAPHPWARPEPARTGRRPSPARFGSACYRRACAGSAVPRPAADPVAGANTRDVRIERSFPERPGACPGMAGGIAGRRSLMGQNVAQKLIASHLVDGEMTPGQEIGMRIDQTLTQDATGTMVMLELEALGPRPGPDRGVGAVRRPQPAAGRRAERGRPPVPALGLPAVRAVVLQGRQRGLATRPTCSGSAIPGKTMVGSDSPHLRGRVAGHARDRRRRPRGRDGDGR